MKGAQNLRQRYFAVLDDVLETEIGDLLRLEDVADPDDFGGIAQAANDAMITSFVGDIQLREDRAAVAA